MTLRVLICDPAFKASIFHLPPNLFIVTGGTVEALTQLVNEKGGKEQKSSLTTDDLTRCEEILSTHTADEIAQRYQQPVDRARNLRIATKRLRYTLEMFEDVLPDTSESIADELSKLQDELGTLHDSDVVIALLRLGLGSEDAGTAYDQAIAKVQKQQAKGLEPEMVAYVLDPKSVPSAEERYGLEQLLQKQYMARDEPYTALTRL